jgi:hypothetical protein
MKKWSLAKWENNQESANKQAGPGDHCHHYTHVDFDGHCGKALWKRCEKEGLQMEGVLLVYPLRWQPPVGIE